MCICKAWLIADDGAVRGIRQPLEDFDLLESSSIGKGKPQRMQD